MAYNIYKDLNKMTNVPLTAKMNIVSVSVCMCVMVEEPAPINHPINNWQSNKSWIIVINLNQQIGLINHP